MKRIIPLLLAATLTGCATGPRVRMETTHGDIVIELRQDRAPKTVENFLAYVDRGDYDGTIIHRVVPGFVIQGGGHLPDLTLLGRDDRPIVNEWDNGLTNLRGTIGMARETDPDSATRQWYINLKNNPQLSVAREDRGGAGYAVFGRVVAGMDVVDAIALVPTRSAPEHELEDVPVEPIVIRSVRRVPD